MTRLPAYLTILTMGLILAMGTTASAYTENQWNDSVYTYGPWDSSLRTAAGGYGARGFQHQAYGNPEYLTDRDFLGDTNTAISTCPDGILCGFSLYEVLQQEGETAPNLFGNEPARSTATKSNEVDESVFDWLITSRSANSTLTTAVSTTTDSDNHPDIGPNPIPTFYWEEPIPGTGVSLISSFGSSSNNNESTTLWVTALAYINASQEIEFVSGNWDVFQSVTNDTDVTSITDRHGAFVVGMPTPADTIDSMRLSEMTAQYSGSAFSTGAPVSWQSNGIVNNTPNLTETPFNAMVNFNTGAVDIVLNGGFDTGVSTYVDSRGTTYASEGIGYTMSGNLNPAGGADFALTEFTAPDGIVTGSGEGSLFGGEAQFIGGVSDVVKTTDDYSARHVTVMEGKIQ